MNRFIQSILIALVICAGCSKSGVVSKSQFTGEFAEALHKASPDLKVEIVKEMELKVTSPKGGDDTVFLDNAYDAYKADPKDKEAVIAKFTASMVESVTTSSEPKELDRTRIVPVIKDRPWLEDMRKEMAGRGAKEIPEPVYDDLNADLIILYAEDNARSIRYFKAKDMEDAHIDKKDLRSLAIENLKRILPKVERRGDDGRYLLTADGTYEASLLLDDSIWTGIKSDVKGDIVIAIPTRDVLMVTGSQDTEGLQKMKKFVNQMSREGTYRLTSKLFKYQDGSWVEFK